MPVPRLRSAVLALAPLALAAAVVPGVSAGTTTTAVDPGQQHQRLVRAAMYAGVAAGDEPPVAERVAEREARGAEGVAAQHEEDRAPPALPPLARVRRSPRRERLASGTHHF